MNKNAQPTTLVPVSHEYKGGDTVEDGHHEVSQSEVDQKVVGDAPHSSVGWGGECNKSSHNISSKLKIKTKLQKYFVLNNKQWVTKTVRLIRHMGLELGKILLST